MEFGVQLYGLRRLYRENADRLFGSLSSMGYRLIEPCVDCNAAQDAIDPVWSADTFAQNEPVWRRQGLRIASCHVFANDLLEALPRVQAFAERFGVMRLVVNCPRARNKDAWTAFAGTCLELGERLARGGVELLLHNGPYDSAVRVGELSAYEWILGTCGEALGAQADVGWLLYGGVNPEPFLHRRARQIRSLHYKDVASVCQDPAADAGDVRLGTGRLDALACFRFAYEKGIAQIVDQDVDNGSILADLQAALTLLHSFCGDRNDTLPPLSVGGKRGE